MRELNRAITLRFILILTKNLFFLYKVLIPKDFCGNFIIHEKCNLLHMKYWLLAETTSICWNLTLNIDKAQSESVGRLKLVAAFNFKLDNMGMLGFCVLFDMRNSVISLCHLQGSAFTSCTYWLMGTTYSDKQQHTGRHEVSFSSFVFLRPSSSPGNYQVRSKVQWEQVNLNGQQDECIPQ